MTCLSDLANHVHIRFINYGFSQILFPQVWNHSFTIALLLSKPSAFHLSMQTGMVLDNMAPTWMNSDDINILTNNKQRTKQSKGQNKRNTTISTSTLIFFPSLIFWLGRHMVFYLRINIKKGKGAPILI